MRLKFPTIDEDGIRMESCNLVNQVGIYDALVMMRTRIFGNIVYKTMIISVQEVYVPGPFFSETGIKNTNGIFTPGIEYF
jgi:hypothetical protein